jgi:siroheme synthase
VVNVKQNEQNPEGKEVLAAAIIKISEAADKLRKSGLNEKAIMILLHHETRVSQRDIKAVLSGLALLRKQYCA